LVTFFLSPQQTYANFIYFPQFPSILEKGFLLINPNKPSANAKVGTPLSHPKNRRMKKNIYENDFDKVVAQINKATVVEGRGRQTNHNNHAEIKLIKMRGPLARQGAFKNINKN